MQAHEIIASMHRAVSTVITCGRQARDIFITRVFCSTLAALQLRTGQALRVCFERAQVVIRCEGTGEVMAIGAGLPSSAARFFTVLALTPGVTATFLDTGVRVVSYERQQCIFAPIAAIACAFT
jgi:hypothetical protein